MLFTRSRLEALEAQTLAPYALKSQESRGRQYPDSEPDYRTAFQRDRDRILHTTAFRRLEYKTQVFVNYEGDYYRTRLTHTLEVAQIGRTLARALGANETLVEAICLGHDLGHPPFGHSGEDVLNNLMREHGGFEHNHQSYRILTQLEKRYPNWPGLNLSYEVLEGIVKHETKKPVAVEGFSAHECGSLEAQLANISDEMAYNAHDLDDGLRAGLLTTEQLKGVGIWEKLREMVGWEGGTLSDLDRHRMIRAFVGLQADSVILQTAANLEALNIQTSEEVQKQGENVVAHNPEMKALNAELKAFLYKHMYYHYRVVRMSGKARRFITDLFEAYISQPTQLQPGTQAQIEQVGLHRAVTDYLAGMTDRYALEEWQRLFDPFVRP